MRRSKVRVVSVAIACALGAVGATSGVATAGAATRVSLLADASDKPGLQAVIYNYERANPDIKIDATYLSVAQRGPLLTTQFQAGNAPDVVVLRGGNGFPPSLVQFAGADRLDPVSSARMRAQPVPSYVRPALTYKGKVYARPLGTTPSVMMDNMSLLKRLGLKRPETFGETIKLCRAIRAKAPNITPITVPGTVVDLFTTFIVVHALNEVYDKNPRWDQQRSAGKVKFQTTPGWRTAVQDLKSLIDAKCFGPNVPAESPTQSAGIMADGKAAIVWAGPQLLSITRTVSKSRDRFGMFQLPQKSRAKTFVVINASANLAVNKKAGNIAAARRFVDFAARPDQNRIYAHLVSTGIASAWERARSRALDKNGLTKADLTANRKTLGPDMGWAAPYGARITILRYVLWPAPEISLAIAQQALGLFTGQSSVDSVLKAADAAWDKAIKK